MMKLFSHMNIKFLRVRIIEAIIQQALDMDKEIIKIKNVGLKWREASGVLLDHDVPLMLKGKYEV